MANQGAKRQVETNRRKLQFLQQLIFIATVCAASDGLAESVASGDFLAPNIICCCQPVHVHFRLFMRLDA